jgi:hypothetical protein
MALRDFVLNNLGWKLTAFVLALLVWLVIKLAIYKEVTGGHAQVLKHQPVMVLKAPDDHRWFRIEPSHVDVVVLGTKELDPDELQVFVDLRTWPEGVNSAFKEVLVRAEDSTKVRVEPLFVMVERVTAPEPSLRNSLRKP